jgi:tripartite-type tricarboxylate transporter receptor subunit TctC
LPASWKICNTSVHLMLATAAPAGTPAAIVARLNAEVVKSLQHPDGKAFMVREGIDAIGSSPAEAAAFFEREIVKFAGIMKIAGVKAE